MAWRRGGTESRDDVDVDVNGDVRDPSAACVRSSWPEQPKSMSESKDACNLDTANNKEATSSATLAPISAGPDRKCQGACIPFEQSLNTASLVGAAQQQRFQHSRVRSRDAGVA